MKFPKIVLLITF